MDDYFLGALGIIVSVVLFLIGYRQTIGAKKERIIAANSEIEKIILRRVVLENYDPSITDLARLLEGKARDFRVKTHDLLSEAQILNCIFTRIIETDLIAQSQREDILSRLVVVLTEAESSPIDETSVIELSSTSHSNIMKFVIPMTMGLLASVMGSLVAFLPQAGMKPNDFSSISELLPVTVALSMTVIMALFFYKRLKESQQDVDISSSSQAIEKAINFERDVAKIIDKYGIKYRASGPKDRGYDFEIVLNDKSTLVEVKGWNRPMPMQLLARIINKLSESVRESKAHEGIIITKTPVNIGNIDVEDSNVKSMTLNEFKTYLKNSK